jgi:hypothetical protein
MKSIALLILLLSLFGAALAQQFLPQFEAYPVSERFSAKPAPAIISNPRARLFRTMITTQAKGQPNFAGHYNLATWGCGSDCRGFALIDARTGKVYFHLRALNVAGVPFQDEDRLQFRPDSRLLIISGWVDGVGGYQEEAKFYYVWENNRFRLIRKTKIKKSDGRQRTPLFV